MPSAKKFVEWLKKEDKKLKELKEKIEVDEKILDTADIKRVELHAHTKMSTQDGVMNVDDYVKTAKLNMLGVGKACDKDWVLYAAAADPSAPW